MTSTEKQVGLISASQFALISKLTDLFLPSLHQI